MNSNLESIALELIRKNGGILAADESIPTIKKRFDAVGLENTPENRRAYREMLLTTQGLSQYINGAILFPETLYQNTSKGISFIDVLKNQGIIPGVKVDLGLVDMPLFKGEQITQGLDGLGERLKEYASKGAKFTKWRAVYHIGDGLPTSANIPANAHGLAMYSAFSQEHGLVPIVEPEVLMQGTHSIDDCYNATHMALSALFEKIIQYKVNLKGLVLKPNMVVPGSEYPKGDYTLEVVEQTIDVLKKTVPNDVPGIAFLSGGLRDEVATEYLKLMNRKYGKDLPWNLTFSFARALQTKPIEIYVANRYNQDNIRKAQEKLLDIAELCSEATKVE